MNGINVSCLTYQPARETNFLFSKLNLHLDAHQITCLIGPNGSGKSTLLKLLAGLLIPQHGSVMLEDLAVRDYSRRALARKLAYLPQQCLLPPSLTVYEYLALSRFCHQSWFAKLQASDYQAIHEAIELTHLKEFVHKPVAQLSAGQQQRARIAFMLAQQVEYLLLDEPMTGLDLKQQRNMIELLLRLKQQAHKTIILVLHDLNQVVEIADRVVILKDGSIAAFGKPNDVMSMELLYNVFDCHLPLPSGLASRA